MFWKCSKTIALLVISALLAVFCGACNSRVLFEEGKLKVVCTVYPVYEFTKEVAGDRADVKLLVKPGSDPHSWELSTDDMLLLEEADILIANGANMEPWLDSCLAALDNKDIQVCIASEGLNLITFGDTTSDEFEEFEEGLTGHDDYDEDHDSHGHDHSHNGFDPHTWLSMDNAIYEINSIASGLSACDSANSDYYLSNAGDYKTRIEALKTDSVDVLSQLEGKTIVVSHEAFGYLCYDYKIMQLPIEGIASDSEPDARTVSVIIDFIRANDIDVIFYDSIINPAAAGVISDETGCKLVKLRSFGSVTGEEAGGGLTYIDAMSENIEALKSAL